MKNSLSHDTIVAYVAGILDGEGTIALTESKSKYSSSFTFSLQVHIYNDSEELIDYIIKWFGGSKYSYTRVNGKVQHTVFWCSSKAQDLLLQLLPYLLIKKDQAELAIQFQDLIRSNCNKPLTDDIVEQRRTFVSLIKLSRK